MFGINIFTIIENTSGISIIFLSTFFITILKNGKIIYIPIIAGIYHIFGKLIDFKNKIDFIKSFANTPILNSLRIAIYIL